MLCNDSFYGLDVNCTFDNYNVTMNHKDESFYEEHFVGLSVASGTIILATIGNIVYRYRGFFTGVQPPSDRI